VVRKAKVMSYEDIKVAQVKHNAKEATVVKGKCGQNCKNSVPVAVQAKRTKRSKLEVTKDRIEAEGMRNYYSVL